MVKYVLGFAFDIRQQQVLLIQKVKPEWQKGCINGIGGKIDEGESSMQAMAREFREEAGVLTKPHHWVYQCEMIGHDWSVSVFYTCTDKIFNFTDMTIEKCGIYSINRLPLNIITNVNWLIPFCLDQDVKKDTVIKF